MGTDGQASKALTVALHQTDQQKVDAIIAKIKVIDLTVPQGTNADAANDKTVIDPLLLTANTSYGLTNDDLTHIKYSGTLVPGSAATVTATVTVGTANGTKDLNIWLTRTDEQKVAALKQALQDIEVALFDDPVPNTSNADTRADIKDGLWNNNISQISALRFVKNEDEFFDIVTIPHNITIASDPTETTITIALTIGVQTTSLPIKVSIVDL